MIMTTMDRYLSVRLLATLAKSLLALAVFYILIDLLAHRSAAIERNDVPWAVVMQYYLASTPRIITDYAAPFAMLVSALLVLGDTAQNNESTAALACGVSLRRFVRMPICLALLFAVGLFATQETIGVAAARTAVNIEQDYFASGGDLERQPVSWASLSGKWTCHVLKFNQAALSGEGVLLYSIQPEIHIQVEAERIFWDARRGEWLLERGHWREFDPKTGDSLLPYAQTRITQRPAPFTETPEELFALEQPPETLAAGELKTSIARAAARNMPIGKYLMRYYTKYSQPALSFVMIWLAIPFAMRLRRGGLAISFGASIAVAVAYVVAYFTSVGLGQMGRLDPFMAAWLPNILFFSGGVYLLWRTPT